MSRFFGTRYNVEEAIIERRKAIFASDIDQRNEVKSRVG